MDDLKERWVSAHLTRARGLRPATIRTYRWGARHFEAWAGVPISAAATPHFIAYLEECEDPPATKHLVLAACTSLAKYESLITDQPLPAWIALGSPKVERPNPIALPPEAATVLLAAADDPIAFRLTHLGFLGGLRIKEMREQPAPKALGIVEWRRDRLIVFGKGAKIREVPIHRRLTREIIDYIRSVPATAGQLAWRVQVLRAETGIFFKSHDERKTFSRTLEELEVDHDVRADLLGHAQSLTSYYSSGVSWRRKVGAIGLLPF